MSVEARGAKAEARALLPLLASGIIAEEIRRDIVGDASRDPQMYTFRLAILCEFDALVQRLSAPALRAGRIKFVRKVNRPKLSTALEAEILQRLRSQSAEAIARALHVPYSAVRRLAITHKTAYAKVGRGRHYTPEHIQKLVEELRSGAQPCTLMRKHHCCAELIRRLRREFLGDFHDRRRLPNGEEIKLALLAGEYPSEVARRFDVGKAYVWRLRKRLGIFKDLRKRNKLFVSDAERVAIVEAGRAGEHVRSLAHRFRHHHYVIRDILREGGFPPRSARLFTAVERKQILKGLRAGKGPGQISREMFNTTKFRSTIWLIRRRWKEGAAWKTAA